MSKIEWCDFTWNAVWGCNTGCPYCFARRIAKRFSYRMTIKEDNYKNNPYYTSSEICMELDSWLYNFKPTWLESNFHRKFPKKSKRIFVNSMSDIWWWKPEWMERVLERIKEYPQHTFMFLTKWVHKYVYIKYHYPENCWLGVTATTPEALKFCNVHTLPKNRLTFVSIEPILESFNQIWLDIIESNFDWIIVGAETGSRPEKVVPEYDWILDINNYCVLRNIPLFEKNNLKKEGILSRPLIQQFPGS